MAPGRPADDPFGDADPVPAPPPGALPVFSSYVRHGAPTTLASSSRPSGPPSTSATFRRCTGSRRRRRLERCAVPMAMRTRSAGVFRGSITSAERFDVQQAFGQPFVDVAATGYNNHRLKVDGGIMGPTTGLEPQAVGSHNFVPLEAQFATYGVQIVADGHAAADRLFHVLRCSGGRWRTRCPSGWTPTGRTACGSRT